MDSAADDGSADCSVVVQRGESRAMISRSKLWETLRAAEAERDKYGGDTTPLDWWEADAIEQTHGHVSRTDWLAERTSGIGGSDVARIVGASPYGSALGLWGEKTGRCQPDAPTDIDAVEMGHLLEPVIAERYAAKHGIASTLWPRYTIVVDDDYPHHRCTPDALTWHDGGWALVQLKTASERERGREVPLHYALQCQWEMMVTNVDRCHLVTLYGGRYLEAVVLAAEVPLQTYLAHWARRFWSLVETRTEPTRELYAGVDPEIVVKDIKRVWPKESGEIVPLPPDIAEASKQIATLNAAIRGAEKRKKEIQQEIIRIIGPAYAAEMPDGSGMWTYKQQHNGPRAAFDSRVLRFKSDKGESDE